MKRRIPPVQTARRALLRDGLTVAAGLRGLGPGLGTALGLPWASAWAAPGPAAWDAAFQATSLEGVLKALGLGPPHPSEEVSLSVQDLAENGAAVPVEFGTRWPQARRLLLVVERNPAVLSAVFELQPETVEPRFSLRIKMAETSGVLAIAMDDEGHARLARREVAVILGGCSV